MCEYELNLMYNEVAFRAHYYGNFEFRAKLFTGNTCGEA